MRNYNSVQDIDETIVNGFPLVVPSYGQVRYSITKTPAHAMRLKRHEKQELVTSSVPDKTMIVGRLAVVLVQK